MAQTEIFKQLTVNNLTLEEAPFASELAMEAFLMENPAVLSIGPKGKAKGVYPRLLNCEISLKNCRWNEAKKVWGDGRLDMLVQYDENTLGIVELKKYAITKTALCQLYDYLNKRHEILKVLKRELNVSDDSSEDAKLAKKIINAPGDIKFIGVLVGASILNDDVFKNCFPITGGATLEMLGYAKGQEADVEKRFGKDGKTLKLDVHAITISRYRSDDSIFVLSQRETQDRNSLNPKDSSKYLFLGEIYSKSALVNAVVKDYAVKNGCTFADLEKAFPPAIQKGKYGVFKLAADAKAINAKSGSRFYTKDEKLITLADGKTVIATCTQWGLGPKENFLGFLKKAQELGYDIEIVEK